VDPRRIDACGAELHGFVPDLQRWLAACDVAVVQGGLTTTMELVAAQRPFLSFPLERHFEQRLHVAHRLARHGASAPLEYATATAESIAQALAAELARSAHGGPGYRRVPGGGAERAAALIAPLLAPGHSGAA
jgi:UDP-N-acetylglucosamine:LPS N-acetylglucosamine transferase